MRPTEAQLRALLVDTISDGFNRSLRVLEEAGAVDARVLRSGHHGTGSRYYDLVTAEIMRTADAAVASLSGILAADPPTAPDLDALPPT